MLDLYNRYNVNINWFTASVAVGHTHTPVTQNAWRDSNEHNYFKVVKLV